MTRITYFFIFYFCLTSQLMASESYHITHLIEGSDGHSYFIEKNLPMKSAHVGYVTDSITLKSSLLGQAGPGSQPYHNPPYPLYIVVLSGTMQIETSRGLKKNFKAGDILLAEDLKGFGHKSYSLNNEPVKYLLLKF